MLRNSKWARVLLMVLMVFALLSGGLTWAKKPVPPPPEPEPDLPFTYAVTWLGALPGATATSVMGMNDSCAVVGTSGARAFVSYVNDSGVRVLEDLNDLLADQTVLSDFSTDYVLVHASGVNNVGQICGGAWNPDVGSSSVTAFRFTPGNTDADGNPVPGLLEDLGQFADGVQTEAKAINGDGDVAGTWRIGPNLGGGFSYSDQDDMVDLGNLGGQAVSVHAINDLGQVVGDDYLDGRGNKAFVYTPGIGMTEIRKDETAYGLTAYDINDVGMSVGVGVFTYPINKKRTETKQAAFLFDSITEQLADLGRDTSAAYGINSEGDIVGASGGTPWVFIEEFGFLSIYDLAETDIGTVRADTLNVNASAQISGNSAEGGAFLLTPVP